MSAPAAGMVRSHRSTTSSRLPGKAIEGDVWRRKGLVLVCEHCGGKRLVYGDGPPSLHAVSYRGPGGTLVDCIMRAVVRLNGDWALAEAVPA